MLLLHKPQQLQHLITHNRYEGESEEAATARWRRVMAAMHVPREACATCLPAYESYCDRVRQLGEEAASAVATLQEVQQASGCQLAAGRQRLGGKARHARAAASAAPQWAASHCHAAPCSLSVHSIKPQLLPASALAPPLLVGCVAPAVYGPPDRAARRLQPQVRGAVVHTTAALHCRGGAGWALGTGRATPLGGSSLLRAGLLPLGASSSPPLFHLPSHVPTCLPAFLSPRPPVVRSSMVRQYLTLAEATGKLEQAPTLALLATMDFYAAAGSVTTPMQK